MNKADRYFIDNMIKTHEEGCLDENPRPVYPDGTPAHTLYITQVYEEYDLNEAEYPITSLRPILVDNGIREIRWIYQDQTSDLSVLEGKYGIKWWRPWEISVEDEENLQKIKTGNIGQRYGATVKRYDLMNRVLNGLKHDPFGRRHIISLWQEDDFKETEGLLPCAFQTLFSVRRVKRDYYLDMTLIQRSSDYLVAGHINKMQYVALQKMVAKHCGYKVGKFAHFVQNLHIYDRHLDQLEELLSRKASNKNPILTLDVPDGTNFYDITEDHFKLIGYEPVKPQLKFELGI